MLVPVHPSRTGQAARILAMNRSTATLSRLPSFNRAPAEP